MKKYQEDCQNTLDLYQAKLNAMEGQIASMRKIMDEKEVTDRANLLVKVFDSKLEKEYQQYKDTSEEKIKKLREDLAEAKDISSNALKRCDEYNSQTIQFQEEIKSLEKSIEEKDEQIASFQTDFLNGYGLETNGKAAGLLGKGDEGESDLLLQKKDEEIEKLKETLEKAENDAKVEVATVMVESGVAYLSNIKKVTKDEEVSFGERLLKNMVSGNCISHIGQQTVDKLRNKISYITDQREKAEEEQARLKQEQDDRLAKEMSGDVNNFYYAPVGQSVGKANIYNKQEDNGNTEPMQQQ